MEIACWPEQHIPCEFCARDLAGNQSGQLRAKRETAAAEFAPGLDRLRASAGKTPATRRRLDAVDLQWEWFRRALELRGDAPYNELVANASESILRSLELISARYEDLLRG